MAMFGTILKPDRERNGMTQAQLARCLRVSLADYRLVEDDKQPASLVMYECVSDLFGWPEAYVGSGGRIAYR